MTVKLCLNNLSAGKKIKGVALLVLFLKDSTLLAFLIFFHIFSGHVNIMAPRSTVQFLAEQIFFLSIQEISIAPRFPCPLLAESTKQIQELQFGLMKVSSALTSKVCLFYRCFRHGQVGNSQKRNTKSTLENKVLVTYCYALGRQIDSKYSIYFKG